MSIKYVILKKFRKPKGGHWVPGDEVEIGKDIPEEHKQWLLDNLVIAPMTESSKSNVSAHIRGKIQEMQQKVQDHELCLKVMFQKVNPKDFTLEILQKVGKTLGLPNVSKWKKPDAEKAMNEWAGIEDKSDE